MAARAMWKGVLHVGDERLPVNLYSAVTDRSVHFRLLHEKDSAPVRQQMVNPETEDVVPSEKTRRGYVTDEGEIVVLRDEDIAGLAPKESRAIEVTRFLPAGAIDHRWFERPYWLGPDGPEKGYFALAEALRRSERQGLARWVMRKQEYAGALLVHGPYLALVTLRPADEVVAGIAAADDGERDLSDKELSMARQLVSMLEGELDLAEYRDEYRARVMELIERKAKGKPVRIRKPPAERPAARDLSAALRASLERVRKVA